MGGSDALSLHRRCDRDVPGRPDHRGRPTRQRLLDTSRAFIRTCTEGRLDLIAHAGTEEAATPGPPCAEPLGDEQISYLGYSYRTAIGQVCADRFPEHVEALVLDGVVDLAEPAVEGAEAQAVKLNKGSTLRGVVPRRGRLPDLGRSHRRHRSGDPGRRREPIPVDAAGRQAGPGEVTLAMVQALYSPSGWDDLAEAFDDARSGDGTGLVRLADSYLGVADFGAYFAVNCLDARWPDVDGLLAAAEEANEAAPTSVRPWSTTTSGAASGRSRPTPCRCRRG